METVSYEKRTVAQLKLILKGRNMPTIGKKADLIARLRIADGTEDKLPTKKSPPKKKSPAKKKTTKKSAPKTLPLEVYVVIHDEGHQGAYPDGVFSTLKTFKDFLVSKDIDWDKMTKKAAKYNKEDESSDSDEIFSDDNSVGIGKARIRKVVKTKKAKKIPKVTEKQILYQIEQELKGDGKYYVFKTKLI